MHHIGSSLYVDFMAWFLPGRRRVLCYPLRLDVYIWILLAKSYVNKQLSYNWDDVSIKINL